MQKRSWERIGGKFTGVEGFFFLVPFPGINTLRYIYRGSNSVDFHRGGHGGVGDVFSVFFFFVILVLVPRHRVDRYAITSIVCYACDYSTLRGLLTYTLTASGVLLCISRGRTYPVREWFRVLDAPPLYWSTRTKNYYHSNHLLFANKTCCVFFFLRLCLIVKLLNDTFKHL